MNTREQCVWMVTLVLGLTLLTGVRQGHAQDTDDPGKEFDQLVQQCLLEGLAGFHEAAEKVTERMQKLAEGPLQKEPLRLAEAKGYRAFVCTLRGQLDMAESLYRESLAIGNTIVPEDHPKRALIYQGLGFLYLHTGQYREAASYFERAVSIAERVFSPDDPELGRALGNLANAYLDQGRYAEAERLIKRARGIYGQSVGGDVDVVYPLNAALAAVYMRQGRFAEAEELCRRVMAATEKLEDQTTHGSSAARQLAMLYQLDGRAGEAAQILAEVSRDVNLDHPGGAILLTQQAMVDAQLGRVDESQQHADQALRIGEKFWRGNHPELAVTLLSLARVDVQRGDVGGARNRLARAIDIFDRSGINSRDRWECHCLRGELAWKSGQQQQAIDDLSRAMDLAEQARSESSGGELERTQSFAQYTDAYARMVDWQTELGGVREAFGAMERSRSQALVDQMAVHGMDLLSGLTESEAESLRATERQAQLRIASARQQFHSLDQTLFILPANRAKQREALESQIRAAQHDFLEAHGNTCNASPAYRLALSADRKPVALPELEQWATVHEALVLEYFVGQEDGYVLVAPAGLPARVDRLRVTDDLAPTLGMKSGNLTSTQLDRVLVGQSGDGLIRQLARVTAPEQQRKVTEVLAALTGLLIPPTELSRLADSKYKRLVIVPDVSLAQLPFETLVVEPGDHPKMLMDVGPPILYAPSATILMNLANRASAGGGTTTQPVLTIGACVYKQPAAPDESDILASLAPRSRYGELGGQLTPLPHTAKEIRWVAEVFGKKGIPVAWLKENKATEAQVRHNVADRRIVHFACHGLVDQQYGNLFGALALTPGAKPDDPLNDGFLTLAEIYELNLKGCELAILSACDTNYGPQQRGEGVWALSRGFLVAGARRVVASNWLVDDAAAASLISYFCSGIAAAEARGEQPDYAQCLHNAKRWVRSQAKWNSPYYWAPFVLVGPS